MASRPAAEIHGSGDPLILLNGIMMTTASWALQVSALAPHFRCVLHDFRGQLRNPTDETSWTLEQHAQDLRELMDDLGIESAHVVGTSYGGEVGMIFAFQHPERVRSLSVIASTSCADETMRRKAALAREVALNNRDALYDGAARSFFSPAFVESHPEMIEQGRARLRACPDSFFRGYAALCDAFSGLDITSELHRIRCRTLVVAAELDTLKPVACSRTIADRIPGARLEIVEGAGHAVVIEKPEVVNMLLLGFLRG
jgi:pimeloyl-ACP methyl ester carboxylesterase